MPETERLDIEVARRGLAPSREKARGMIMAGEVTVDGVVRDKPGMRIPVDSTISTKAKPRFVSRGGDKLDAALTAFQLVPQDFVCADVGASTGGFTDCLLQHGAARVYAIDVGYGHLDTRLRSDPRVVVMERTNARFVDHLDELVDLAVVDASFISLRLLLPVMIRWLKPTGSVVALIKPQFEAGRRDVGKGGVVRDTSVHRRVLHEALAHAGEIGLHPHGLIRSPLVGPAGNIEFLVWLSGEPSGGDIKAMIEQALATDR
ncbi:MAG: TlyA family RNA methyltransferase [Anaerolineae bacterium]|nr:MAG: putative hemolysin [Chloroflexi bacterium OLB13]MBV6435731.1 16S/23S rRNA (cytidine-2'-O)-methyltransferase TlyA [Anaerolineae bacterium]MCO6445782.1 TlyA family RNA methyltransferase [Anaerolineae bacterium]RIK23367.1 MAG: TlyA family rRNA (cytidine-2'-O)-methyltransferase [Chloroflexota bacterium]